MAKRRLFLNKSEARITTLNHDGFKVIRQSDGKEFTIRKIYNYLDVFDLNIGREEIKFLNVDLPEKLNTLLEQSPRTFLLDSDGDFQLSGLTIKSDMNSYVVNVEIKVEDFLEVPLCAHIVNVFP